MRTRVTALAAVVAFALTVATVAVLAGRGDDQDLVKLPLGAAGFAADGAATAADESRSAMLAPAFGGVEYKVVGTLPDLASTAPAYRLGAGATEDDVRALGRALGLAGDVKQEGDRAWVLTDGDLELRVERAPGVPWYLGKACPEPVARPGSPDGEVASCEGVAVAVASQVDGSVPTEPTCKEGTGCSVPPDPAVVVPAPAPAPPTCVGDAVTCAEPEPVPPEGPPPTSAPVPPPEPPPRPADLPSRAEAEALARAHFERLGVSTDGFKMEDGWATWEAWVEPRLDGLRVFGQSHAVSIGPNGAIVRAAGFLGRPERIGDYPLVGVAKALERLESAAAAGGWSPAGDGVATLQSGREPATTVVDSGSASSAGSTGAGLSPEEADKLAAGAGTGTGAVEPAIGDCADPTVSCMPPPGPPAQPIVQTITGAHLALLQIDTVLVPVYVFELEDAGETFPVPAVTDQWLQDQVPAPAPAKEN